MPSETISSETPSVFSRPMFTKDFSLFRPAKGPLAKKNTIPPPTPPAPDPPKPAAALPQTHHSSLLLLAKHDLEQTPPRFWDHHIVNEVPPSRGAGHRTHFQPETPARQGEARQRRLIEERRAERQRRSCREGWLDGPAQMIAEALEEIEDVRNDLRDAARWENAHLEMRTKRKTWLAPEEEKRVKKTAVDATRGVMAMEWCRIHEPSTVAVGPSAASIRSERRNSMVSVSRRSTVLEGYRRDSMLSATSTVDTPRSSMMSITQISDLSSPITSGLPSPELKADALKGERPVSELRLEGKR